MMTPDSQISALLDEAAKLKPESNSRRLSQIYSQAASLVDKVAKPTKFGAFRLMYGKAILPSDPQSALAAFREALPYFDPIKDRGIWAECKSYIGWVLLKAPNPFQHSEEIIECLEATIAEYPYMAWQLADHYAARVIGDPLENWCKQVRYLELARQQPDAQTDPVAWSAITDSLANALTREPDGNFQKAVETRIDLHRQVLQKLTPIDRPPTSEAQKCWIMTCVNLNEAYLTRVEGKPAENRKIAEQFAREAYQTAGASQIVKGFATLALARTLLDSTQPNLSKERCLEGLRVATEATALIDPTQQPVLAATNLKFRALAYLRLLELGDASQLKNLLDSADRAYTLLDSVSDASLQRVIMQIASDGLLAANQFVEAIHYLQRAVDAGERQLAHCTSRAARLEAIFELHDSYARLGYCQFQAGDIPKGIEAIDAGKGRLWRPNKSFASFAQAKALVPANGALLFPVFAPKNGAVAVITQTAERICPLQGFGREQLTNLLTHDLMNPESESWLARYIFRDRDLPRWQRTIDAMGSHLFDLFWTPLQETLRAMGVGQDAELLCFPQAGLGALPLHAAWTQDGASRHWIADQYAIRYAPSFSCLVDLPNSANTPSTLFVSDSLGDLPNTALELFWVGGAASVLTGNKATKTNILAELAQASRAYFATHAEFRVDDPFQSNLVLANNERLNLQELVPLLAQYHLREVILSCCETAVTQVWRRPDELLGFPTALLEHGVSTVIATQWPVSDWAAAALMGKFYREWQTTTAAEAMRRAQHWMRQVTADELLELLKPIVDQPEPLKGLAIAVRQSLRELEPNAHPLAAPYYWAPFTVSGI
jgi:CHAT domain-containing protein